MEVNEIKQVSDNDFDSLFLEGAEEIKTNAFTSKAGKSDVDKLIDGDEDAVEKTEEVLAAEKEAKEKLDKDSAIDNLLDSEIEEEIEEEEDQDEESSKMVKAISSLVEKGKLQLFVDDKGELLKELKDYTIEEMEELISENIDTAIETTATNAPLEMFSSFPKAIQDVISFQISGGKEEQLKGLFMQLAQVQETLDLDPEKEEDARRIIKQHLELENLHTPEEIEDQITKIEDLGKLTDYSTKYKKVLDAKQAAVLKKRIADQEIIAAQNKQKEIAHAQKIYETLKVPFADLDLDVQTRESLYHGLVQKKHQNEKGEAINELTHLINQKSSGTKEDAELLVKAFAYLKSPKTFIDSLEKNIKAKIQKELTDELKDGNSRNATSSVNAKQNPVRKKLSGLPKKANFFSR